MDQPGVRKHSVLPANQAVSLLIIPVSGVREQPISWLLVVVLYLCSFTPEWRHRRLTRLSVAQPNKDEREVGTRERERREREREASSDRVRERRKKRESESDREIQRGRESVALGECET